MTIRKMKVKESHRQYRLSMIVFLVLMIGWCRAFAASPFFPEQQIRIETRYSDHLKTVMGDLVNWHLSFKSLEDRFSIQYHINGKELFCSLVVEPSDTALIFTLSGSDNRVIDRSSEAFIPFTGFPAPCRIFKLNDMDNPGSFTIIRDAGGRKFSNQFHFEIQPVTFEKAVEMGWLGPDASKKNGIELVLISIKNTAGDTLFFQLWEKGSAWWLYEETQDSRSWKKD